MIEIGRDKKLVNPVSINASIVILGACRYFSI